MTEHSPSLVMFACHVSQFRAVVPYLCVLYTTLLITDVDTATRVRCLKPHMKVDAESGLSRTAREVVGSIPTKGATFFLSSLI